MGAPNAQPIDQSALRAVSYTPAALKVEFQMLLHGELRITLESVRELAIECHALDVDAYPLLWDSTHADKAGRTKAVYEKLVASKLIGFAVALRTKFYQGLDHNSTLARASFAGFLDRQQQGVSSTDLFTFKDVCDKIIHAESVERHLEAGVLNPTTTIRGNEPRRGSWELSISVSLFIEAVLDWLDEVEEH